MMWEKTVEIEITVDANDSGMRWPCCDYEDEFDEGYGDLPWDKRYDDIECPNCDMKYHVENTPHWSLTASAAKGLTDEELVAEFRKSCMRDRERYGSGENWRPEKIWDKQEIK